MNEILVRVKLFFTAYRHEGLLLVISFLISCIGIICLALAFRSSSQVDAELISAPTPKTTIVAISTSQKKIGQITVDVSGAVKNSDTYTLPEGSRLADAIKLAGGLSAGADTDYFYRNYNNAHILVDQEKIYVPRRDEIERGVFVEESYVIDQHITGASVTPTAVPLPESDQSLLTINTATQAQIEDLPGIGPVSAGKLIQNRPYSSFDDLRSRSGLSESTLTKFQDQISYE